MIIAKPYRAIGLLLRGAYLAFLRFLSRERARRREVGKVQDRIAAARAFMEIK